MVANEVFQCLFEDDFSLSEDESSDEEGKGMFAYAGQQHLDTVELATMSSEWKFSLIALLEPTWMFQVKCIVK